MEHLPRRIVMTRDVAFRTRVGLISDHNATVAQQDSAEAEVERFRDQLGPFVVAAEKTRMAMVFTNSKVTENPIIFANDSFLELTGYERDEVLGASFTSLMAKGLGSAETAMIDAAFAGTADSEPVICYRRRDETTFWASVFISPVCNADGGVVQHFVSIVDETEHHKKQDHCEMLIDELNHRVKNTLATVQSITRQALRNSNDPATIGESIESRIFCLVPLARSAQPSKLGRCRAPRSDRRCLKSVRVSQWTQREVRNYRRGHPPAAQNDIGAGDCL
jgi:PAS domain S-box-containing protein